MEISEGHEGHIDERMVHCISRQRTSIDLDRVIVPEEIKKEILEVAQSYLRKKSKHEDLGIYDFFGYGKGLTFLFHGPSGTGKTMLAHALAHRLQKELISLKMRDVFLNNMPPIEEILKYVFNEAKLSGAILFLDEFGGMCDEGTILSRAMLIEIEKSECITILASNKVDNLDPAFDRRINMKVYFDLPDEAQRERIWKALIPPKVALKENVDMKSLAKRFQFTGGLIKNSILMAIQNGIEAKDDGRILLTNEMIEKAAARQAVSMLDHQGSGKIYQPKNRLRNIALTERDRNVFQQLVEIYQRDEKDTIKMAVVIGSSDTQIGVDCVDAVAHDCNLKVKRFPFSSIIFGHEAPMMAGGFPPREIGPIDQVFKPCLGQKAVTLVVDNDSLFEKFLARDQDKSIKELTLFVEKLRDFQGFFFLVTGPLKEIALLPAEIHYFEIKHAPEEIQIRRWQEHFKWNGLSKNALNDLVERYPMHLREIDFTARELKIRETLNGDDKPITPERLTERIGRFKKRKEKLGFLGERN